MKTEDTPIQAWETKDGLAMVWGTHDAKVATSAYNTYLADDTGLLHWEEWAVPEREWVESPVAWGDPELLSPEMADYPWPEAMQSSEPVQGWIPFLVVSQ